MKKTARELTPAEDATLKVRKHIESAVRDTLKQYPQKPTPEWLLPTFQALALRTAQFVETVGFENSSPLLRAISQNVKDIGQSGWRDAAKLGNAFHNAVKPPKPKTGNPFAGLKL